MGGDGAHVEFNREKVTSERENEYARLIISDDRRLAHGLFVVEETLRL